MADADRERAMIRLLERDTKRWLSVVSACCPHSWSVSFTEEFVGMVEHNTPNDPAGMLCYQLRSLLGAASRCAMPEARWPEHSEIFASSRTQLLFAAACATRFYILEINTMPDRNEAQAAIVKNTPLRQPAETEFAEERVSESSAAIRQFPAHASNRALWNA